MIKLDGKAGNTKVEYWTGTNPEGQTVTIEVTYNMRLIGCLAHRAILTKAQRSSIGRGMIVAKVVKDRRSPK